MIGFALKRLCLGAAIMVFISLVVFTLTNIATDPAIAIAGEGATASDIEAARHTYGFDRPIPERYAQWLGEALSGNFGTSYREHRPVSEVVLERLPVTVVLGCLAIAIGLVLALPLAVLASVRPGGAIDRIALTFALFGQAMPSFWLALLGILVFAVILGWLPASGSERAIQFVLPAITLGIYAVPPILRLTRSGMIEVLSADYIRTARAKGLLPPSVLIKHALRNAIVPVVSIASVQFGTLLGGSVVVETIFAMHGIGYLAWEAISNEDIPVIQALILVTSFFYVILTLLADLLNAWLDPRIRLG